MFEAFLDDKTNFKLWMVIKILLAAVLLVAAFMLHNEYVAERNKNLSLSTKYETQATWLKNFDYKGTLALQREMLKPARQEEVHSIINKQIEIFKKYNVDVESVATTEFKAPPKPKNPKNKGPVLNSVKTSVSLKGNWEDLKAALNEFDNSYLVGINEISIVMLKSNGVKQPNSISNKKLSVKFNFNTYYM